jgi:peptidoglycan/LPS O-acetylase OafA/YrhL
LGILRFLLAISLLFYHTGPFFGITLVDSRVAVQAFFIISGFYMALILNEKYTGHNSYYLFLTNRFLRLFPAYWCVLLISIVFFLILYSYGKISDVIFNYFTFFGYLDIKAQVSILFANLFIFGQDLLLMAQINTSSGFFSFTPDIYSVAAPYPPVYSFSFIPQAWSIGTELLFYAIAPFIVKRKALYIAAVLAASLGLRMVLFNAGYFQELWNFRFFPTELALFLLGALSYKVYKRWAFMSNYGLYAFLVLIIFTISYQFIPSTTIGFFEVRRWTFYCFLFLLIPSVFSYTSRFKADKYLGELSYPLYISHMFVIWLLLLFLDELLSIASPELLHIGVLIFALISSAAIFHMVITPLERYRQRRVRKLPCQVDSFKVKSPVLF